jgi:hypothetical protein
LLAKSEVDTLQSVFPVRVAASASALCGAGGKDNAKEPRETNRDPACRKARQTAAFRKTDGLRE